MSGITMYRLDIAEMAEPGNRVVITSQEGWMETRKTYKNISTGQRELKVDMEKVSFRGYLTIDESKLVKGAFLILEIKRRRAAETLKTAQAQMDRLNASKNEIELAFNSEPVF